MGMHLYTAGLRVVVFLLFVGIEVGVPRNSVSAGIYPKPADELRVLFIGNSLTYTNDLPSIVEALAKASGQRKFAYKMMASPNFSLEDHWNSADSRKALSKGKWDYVVMQQGPSAGLEGRTVLLDYGRRFAEEIKRSGATPAMYMVWPASNRAGDFDGVRESYRLAAEAIDGLFFPVGEAWLAALHKDRGIKLYSEDGFHPSVAGSYLAALVMYEQLYTRSPLGLPAKLSLRSGGAIEVSTKDAEILQLAAKETNEKYKRLKVNPTK